MKRALYAFFDHAGIPAPSAYATPLLAALMQPVHDFDLPHGASAVRVLATVWRTDGLRYAIGEIEDQRPSTLPFVSSTARTAFAVLCARSVYAQPDFLWWADGWLSGRDRTPATAFKAFRGARPGSLPMNDRAYVAHWATMSAAFPHEWVLASQTAALIAAYVSAQLDFEALASAALAIE